MTPRHRRQGVALLNQIGLSATGGAAHSRGQSLSIPTSVVRRIAAARCAVTGRCPVLGGRCGRGLRVVGSRLPIRRRDRGRLVFARLVSAQWTLASSPSRSRSAGATCEATLPTAAGRLRRGRRPARSLIRRRSRSRSPRSNRRWPSPGRSGSSRCGIGPAATALGFQTLSPSLITPVLTRLSRITRRVGTCWVGRRPLTRHATRPSSGHRHRQHQGHPTTGKPEKSSGDWDRGGSFPSFLVNITRISRILIN